MDAETGKEFDGQGVLRHLWEHHWWSIDRLVAAGRTLSDEEFRRELGINYNSFHGALAHLVGSEMVWLARTRGESVPRVPGAAELSDLPAIEGEWERCKEGWQAILSGGDLERTMSYSNTKGDEFRDPLWPDMTHLVDHGACYRGVLVAALRLLGRTPPLTGLIMYTRQQKG